jgi:hypothetical protein
VFGALLAKSRNFIVQSRLIIEIKFYSYKNTRNDIVSFIRYFDLTTTLIEYPFVFVYENFSVFRFGAVFGAVSLPLLCFAFYGI